MSEHMNKLDQMGRLVSPHYAYWKWDEKYNNTVFKLGRTIEELLAVRSGAVLRPPANPNKFFGNIPGGPKYVYVVDNKIVLVFFGNCCEYPEISKGIWRLHGDELVAELNKFLEPIDDEPTTRDPHLLVNFTRSTFVDSMSIFTPDENKGVPDFSEKVTR